MHWTSSCRGGLLALSMLAGCGPGGSDGDGSSDDTDTDTGETGNPDPNFPQGEPCGGFDTDCGDVPEDMVCVPAGEVTLGGFWEQGLGTPPFDACLATFHIERTEVTVDAYRECVEAAACDVPDFELSASCAWNDADAGARPINCVSWLQAQDYCAWAGRRLPTSDEWEKAARGSDARDYPWGNDEPTCDLVVFNPDPFDDPEQVGCEQKSTWDVGSRSPAGDSPFGAADMSGNVAEITATYLEEDVSPPVPMDQWQVAVRGGSYVSSYAPWLRPYYRVYNRPEDTSLARGFRCAADGP